MWLDSIEARTIPKDFPIPHLPYKTKTAQFLPWKIFLNILPVVVYVGWNMKFDSLVGYFLAPILNLSWVYVVEGTTTPLFKLK